MEGNTNFSRSLEAVITGIVECLEIIDIGCNLKQFDGLTWLTLTPYFMTDLRHWFSLHVRTVRSASCECKQDHYGRISMGTNEFVNRTSAVVGINYKKLSYHWQTARRV